MYFNLKQIPLIATLIFAVQAADPISFLGDSVAESSVSKTGTTLSASKGTSGAQFLYAKNVKDAKTVSLAVVSLLGPDGFAQALQEQFDVISQKCSCYWLDINELSKKFPKLKSGTYTITMKGSDYEVKSGTFKLEPANVAGDDQKDSATSTTKDKAETKTTKTEEEEATSSATSSSQSKSSNTKPTGTATKIKDPEESDLDTTQTVATSTNTKKDTKSLTSKSTTSPSDFDSSNANTSLPSLTSALLLTVAAAFIL